MARYAERIAAGDLSESLYLFYRERLGLWIARAEDRVGVGPGARTGRRTRFRCPRARVCGYHRAASWGQDGQIGRSLRAPGLTRTSVRYVARLK